MLWKIFKAIWLIIGIMLGIVLGLSFLGLIIAEVARAQPAGWTGPWWTAPVCTGDPGPMCWQEFDNKPGCWSLNRNDWDDVVITWSGECRDGRPDGFGVAVYYGREAGKRVSRSQEGLFMDGKPLGRWVYRNGMGQVLFELYFYDPGP
ncbi:MAG: hypothetical protein OXC91_02200 [Rhodobacteraceae bacterium]|nr:hypothetical protein [Paracoccaceae bacterium]